jgi:hypothetical protein
MDSRLRGNDSGISSHEDPLAYSPREIGQKIGQE